MVPGARNVNGMERLQKSVVAWGLAGTILAAEALHLQHHPHVPGSGEPIEGLPPVNVVEIASVASGTVVGLSGSAGGRSSISANLTVETRWGPPES